MSDNRSAGSSVPTSAASDASPQAARVLMMATYVAGAVGLFIGFSTVGGEPPSLTWAVILIVVIGGGVSFIRHSIFHRSDAARLGWTSPGRNNFQIEVGIANLAWAVVAVLAVVLGWGIAVQAGTLLTFGIYLAGSAAMLLLSSSENRSRSLGPVVAMALFGVMQIVLGFLGMSAA